MVTMVHGAGVKPAPGRAQMGTIFFVFLAAGLVAALFAYESYCEKS